MEGYMEASHDVAVHSTVGATTYANIIRATAETWTAAEFDRTGEIYSRNLLDPSTDNPIALDILSPFT